jgi:hypothetical protein
MEKSLVKRRGLSSKGAIAQKGIERDYAAGRGALSSAGEPGTNGRPGDQAQADQARWVWADELSTYSAYGSSIGPNGRDPAQIIKIDGQPQNHTTRWQTSCPQH